MSQSTVKSDALAPTIILPPHYAIRRYFREQDSNFEQLDLALGEGRIRSWHEKYRNSKASSSQLIEFAEDCENIFRENGGFSISRTSNSKNSKFPHREMQSASAFLMSPITLGEGWFEEGLRPYHENALLLRYAHAHFKTKKASLGLAVCGFLFTQHALERVYERSESDQQRFAAEIHAEITGAMQGLALVNAGSLWVKGEGSLVTAIPFLNGLMIINHRICVRTEVSPEMGFRIALPGGAIQSPYLNKTCAIDDRITGSDENLQFFILPCATTYFDFTTLNEAQSDYLFLFRALESEIGAEHLRALAGLMFTPDLAHEKATPDFKLLACHEKRKSQLLSALNAGWLKADKPQPVASILPFGFEPLKQQFR